MRLATLRQEQQNLQDQIEQLLQSGDCLQGVRLEFTPAGGTASDQAKQSCKYARLRAGRGKILDNGKKSKYIQLHQIAEYKAAIARGKQLTRLTRRLETVEAEIAKIETVAQELGLELPSD